MSHHPAYTMALISTAGGIAGYARSRSIPSLGAGLGIGVLYGVAGYLISQNRDHGHETAAVASTVLAGAMLPRAFKTRKALPVALSVGAVAAGGYYIKKIAEYM